MLVVLFEQISDNSTV